jgi:DNA polymerase IV
VLMERTIVHLDLDNFFSSVECLRNPALKGWPLIIGGGPDRGVVASCNELARRHGVRVSMPMSLAQRLCPQARVLRGDMELYSRHSHTVTEIIRGKAPVMEKAAMDEFYLDVSGLDKFFGCFKWTGELGRLITRESGLDLSFGLSVNKTVSKIATGEARPHGSRQVPRQEVKPFLDPLSIKKIPALGDANFQLLSRIGIRTIQTLSEMPVEMLQELLGPAGAELWKKANGIDEKPVEPYQEKKSISAEQSFAQDTIDLQKIRSVLTALVEKLGFQARNEGWLCSTIVLKIRYNNQDTHTRQCRVPYTSQDHVIMRTVMDLFEKVYERRMRLRLVGVRLSGLVRGTYQVNLFEDTTEMISLYSAIDKMKKRFGDLAIQRGAGLNALSLR